MKRFAVAVACCFAFLLARETVASPCCVSATHGGVGRLAPWEDAAVSLSQSVAEGLGRWDTDGDFQPYTDFSEREWRTSAAALVGFHRRALAYAIVPWLVTERSSGDLADTGAGLADVELGVRYQWLDFGETPSFPALALVLGLTAPTGRDPSAARGTLASDATGRGAWVPEGGIQLELARRSWFVRLNAMGTVPLPMTRGDTGEAQRFGPGVASSVVGGSGFLRDRLVLSASTRLRIESSLHVEGRPLPGSSQRRLGVGVQGSLALAEHWTLLANGETDLVADGLGRNAPAQLGVGLGVRYGFF